MIHRLLYKQTREPTSLHCDELPNANNFENGHIRGPDLYDLLRALYGPPTGPLLRPSTGPTGPTGLADGDTNINPLQQLRLSTTSAPLKSTGVYVERRLNINSKVNRVNRQRGSQTGMGDISIIWLVRSLCENGHRDLLPHGPLSARQSRCVICNTSDY